MTTIDTRGLAHRADTSDAAKVEVVVQAQQEEVTEQFPKVEGESRPWRKPQWRPRHVRMGC